MVRDWDKEAGDIKTSGRQFVDGQQETARNIFYRLRLFLGEYFLDVSDGTPWFQGILGKAPQDVAETNIKRRILSAPRVAGIERFTFATDRRQRRLTVSSRVIDRDSQTVDAEIDEELI